MKYIISLVFILLAGYSSGSQNHYKYEIDPYEEKIMIRKSNINNVKKYYNAKLDFIVSHYREFNEHDEKMISLNIDEYSSVVYGMVDSNLINNNEAFDMLMNYVESRLKFSDFDFDSAKSKYLAKYNVMGVRLESELENKNKLINAILGNMVSLKLIEPIYVIEKSVELQNWRTRLISGGKYEKRIF